MLTRGPNPNSGEGAAANWLRRLLAAVAANKILPGVGYKVKYSSLGTTLEVMPGKMLGGTISKRYRVKSVQGDYLTCRTWDGTTEGGTDVLVAKPPQLRHSIESQTIDGASVTYSDFSISGGVCKRIAKAADEDDQNEMVIPVYQLAGEGVDAEIWADKPEGGTGVLDDDDNPIVWQDTNRDARAWCHLSSETLSSS
jgi:hypothetical protein